VVSLQKNQSIALKKIGQGYENWVFSLDVGPYNLISCIKIQEALHQHQATQNPQKPFLTPSLRKKSGYARNTTYDSWVPGPKYNWKLETPSHLAGHHSTGIRMALQEMQQGLRF
jgi:hypothetical protein